jgi:DNA polymerase I-like protein with 3'-5' exonuclease and polymerase domains
MILTFDFECNTVNKANPFTASGKSICYAVKHNDGPVVGSYYTEIGYMSSLRESFAAAKLIVGFNVKFDLHWASRHGVVPRDGVRVWDCQIAEFVIRGQKGAYPSLNECLVKYGLGQKDDRVVEYWALGIDTEDIPQVELQFYNDLDVELTYKLYLEQLKVMSDKQKRLCMLMGLDLLVLQEMEKNGVKFDIDKCREKEHETGEKLDVVTRELLEFAPTPHINLDSGQQLSCLLYGGAFELTSVESTETLVYKSGKRKGEEYVKSHYKTEVFHCDPLFKPLPRTEYKLKLKTEGKEYTVYQGGEDVLKQLRATSKKQKRIIELLLLRAEYAKLMDTYYGKLPILLENMEWGEYLHGQYNQCVASTGRLSSSNPNMQNFSGQTDELLITRYDN